MTNALTVKVTSAPQRLVYKEGYIETGVAGDDTKPAGAFDSDVPELIGSLDGVSYEIVSVKKNGSEADPAEAAKFSIDAATGRITVGADHGFTVNDVYTVDVNVTNDFSEEGEPTLMEDALTLNVVEWIEALTSLTYNDVTDGMRAIKISNKPTATEGGKEALVYSFVNLDEKLASYLSINPTTGEVSAAVGNEIEPGEYTVTVQAKNYKNTIEGSFKLTVAENPCYFTYIHYGTNLDGDEEACQNQYRFTSYDQAKATTLTPSTDVKGDVTMTWKLAEKHQSRGVKIPDTSTGVISLAELTEDNWNKYMLPVVFVTATAKTTLNGKNISYARTVPVAFHYSRAINGVKVEYTPFLFHVSPIYGGRSAVPAVSGVDASQLVLDYRRTFNWYNLNGVNSEGESFADGTLSSSNYDFILGHLYQACGSTNYGAKLPLSFFDNGGTNPKTDPSRNTLAYVDNTSGSPYKYSVVVNPQMWNDDGWADGVFTGQMTFTTDGTSGNTLSGSLNQIFPIAIWFDKTLPQPKE